MGDLRDHWEGVYATKAETAVSWYQRHSTRSLAYVTAAAGLASHIVDIGGGASTLVDDLLELGYANVTVLDISETALAKAKARLGDRASRVTWIAADITRWQPPRLYGVWHDRAVFHFLTKAEDQDAISRRCEPVRSAERPWSWRRSPWTDRRSAAASRYSDTARRPWRHV